MLQVLVPQTPSVFIHIAIPGLLFTHFKSNIKTLFYHTKVFLFFDFSSKSLYQDEM